MSNVIRTLPFLSELLDAIPS
ncbi:MAG: hypothetical protein QG577_2538, partial [Thermodesulfobacteriota bacterium]|nr:hypothetical protein [Thermodesulfobacteriota bacterium]